MKILGIRIKNLASLEGESEINFTVEPLCSAGIFAITGPTGAGKSTILDAICLALYGKTPRYIQAKESGIELADTRNTKIPQSDVRGILRDGTSEGLAEVHFVGVDGYQYKALWQVKRAYGKIDGALQGDSVTLTRLDTNTVTAGRKTETFPVIEKLVGLNFEQFTRSVLLAQGDFTAFLKANKEEKGSLLEKLTGNFIYTRISQLVFDKWRKAEQDLRELNIQKESILILSEEQLELIEVEQSSLDIQTEALENTAKNLGEEQTWHVRFNEMNDAVIKARDGLAASMEVKVNANDRVAKLSDVSAAQATKSWNDALKQASGQLEENRQEAGEINDRVAQLNETSIQNKTSLLNEETTLKDLKGSLIAAAPFFDQARRLDVQMAEKRNQVNQCQEDVASVILEIEEHNEQLRLKNDEVGKFKTEIDDLQDWIDKFKYRQPIANNINLISSKLTDAGKTLLQLNNLKTSRQDTANKMTILASDIQALEKRIQDQNVSLTGKLAVLQQHQSKITSVNITNLRSDKQLADNTIEQIIEAVANWRLCYQAQLDFKSLSDTHVENQNSLTANKNLLPSAKKSLDDAKIKRDLAAATLNKAKLRVADTVEDLRASLVDGEPCPVCGSPDHPDKAHSSALAALIKDIEESFQNSESDYETCLNKHSDLLGQVEHLEGLVNAVQNQLSEKRKKLEQVLAKWQQSSLKSESDIIPDENKESWLNEKLAELRKKQQNLDEQISLYTKHKENIETVQGEIENLKSDVAKLTNQLKEKEGQSNTLGSTNLHQKQQEEKCDVDLKAIHSELEPYFEVKTWFDIWQKDAKGFIKQLEDFSRLWAEKTAASEAARKQEGIASTELSGLNKTTLDLSTKLKKNKDTLATLEADLKRYVDDRNKIFGGQDIANVQNRFEQQISDCEKRIDEIRLKKQNTEKDIVEAQTRLSALSKDAGRLNKLVAEHSEKIEKWLIDYNLTLDIKLSAADLVELLNYDHQWIETERRDLKAIDDVVTRSQSVFDERTGQFEVHKSLRISEKDHQEILDTLETTKTSLQTANRTKTENNYKIQQDITNKQTIAGLLIEIESKRGVFENWSKLNEIIGSADGKKFRQIAQEFTLDVLLSFANIHLQMLSKRYSIKRIDNTLGLQVVDKDMGDEVRTVYSLSGGESFLVSLALALGLAELSSSKMNVESLFIDEGFGTLDPTTLTIAMGALEALHNQGRKVCVISHVQELMERIPAQIKVTKLSNGKSKLEVSAW